jgi:hypothetical protein
MEAELIHTLDPRALPIPFFGPKRDKTAEVLDCLQREVATLRAQQEATLKRLNQLLEDHGWNPAEEPK